MQRLRIDLAELADAFEHSGAEISYYLDLENGAVVMLGQATRHMLDQLYETVAPGERQSFDLDAALARRELVAWLKDDLRTAHRIDRGFGSRYLQVPASDSFEGYADMKAFIETLSDRPFAERLWSAIQGKGPSRRFKDALATQPALEQRWYAFKDRQVHERISAWLAANDLEAEP